MAILDSLAEIIANKTWAIVLTFVLWLLYEIVVRRIPTTSPYISIAHIVGRIFKYLGKQVLKIIGENLAKETISDKDTVEEIVDDKKGKKLKIFKL